MIEVTGLLVFIVVIGAALTYLDSPLRNKARYSGKTYDPQEPLLRRAGAERIGMTGKQCYFCDQVTYGYSEYCGRCKRLSPAISLVRVESTVHPVPPSLPASEVSSLSPVPESHPRHDQTATAQSSPSSSSDVTASAQPGGTRRRSGGAS